MMIGNNRHRVIENIKVAAENGDFYAKVELDDPVLTSEESKGIVKNYVSKKDTLGYRIKRFFARRIVNVAMSAINKETEIVGSIDPQILKGAIITSNHFGPLENTVVRYFAKQFGQRRLSIVSQVTNFAMKGFIGFIMNYADTVPLPTDARQMVHDFMAVLEQKIKSNGAVLIYPEQEMWFNYRKPRPPKKGAYHFAAKLRCPVVSCFVEIIDCAQKENDSFYKTKYRVHILDVLYPDGSKSVRDNSEEMCRKDYALKKAAYEKCYGKELTYAFDASDIAGWIGGKNEK